MSIHTTDPIQFHGIRGYITVKDVLDAIDNAYDNHHDAVLNFGEEGMIFGQVNSVTAETTPFGKHCVMTLAPYKNGYRMKDGSLDGMKQDPLRLQQIKKLLSTMPSNAIVIVRYKDVNALNPTYKKVVDDVVSRIDDDSRYGIFMRRDDELHPTVVEARHDGIWQPRHQTRRIQTGKKPMYYIALDYSGEFNDGQYLTPNGGLTRGPSNREFDTSAFKTVIPAKLDQMVKLAVKKYGNEMYVHVFRQSYSHGMQTQKDHVRAGELLDKWSPKGKYWLYDYAPVEALVDSAAAVNEDDVDESIDFNKNGQTLKIFCRTNADYNGTYEKADIEDEMRDVGTTPHSPSEWMEWVLEHMFSDEIDWTTKIQDAFMSPNVMKMEVSLGNSIVKLEKY